MQTILGSGGVIGIELARVLPQYTPRIRLVSRNPKKVNPSDELYQADITHYTAIAGAVKGSEVVYLVAGLPYSFREWNTHWVNIMKHTIDACIQHHARLVFFDNVYLYGLVKGWMTEESPVNPNSKKGAIRAEVVRLLQAEFDRGTLNALICRAADFYGPGSVRSMVDSVVIQRFKKKKAAQWLGDLDAKHSFTFTPDAGRATALLGNTPDAYGQTWHLPTDQHVLTCRQFIAACAEASSVPMKVMRVPPWMLKGMGLFNPLLRELDEMMYQLNNDYLFDSAKFEKRFFPATPYAEGIRVTVQQA